MWAGTMTRRSEGPSEHQIQKAVFQWLRAVHPKIVAYAIPNAARRSAAQAAYLKAEGLRAGMPDIVIARPCGGFHGLYIELKTKTGRISDVQKQMLFALAAEDYACAVARSVDEAINLITTYLEGRWNDLLQSVTKH